MPKQKITPDLLQAALVGFEVEKQRIEAKIAELRAQLGSSQETAATSSAKSKRKKRSAGKFSATSAPFASGPTKRMISAAARKAIATAMKKRWAPKRAARSGTDGTGPRDVE